MLWGTQGSHLPVPQSVAHLICVPQVPQMWHKMWHSSDRPPQGAPHQATRFTPPAHLRPGYCTIRDDIASYFFPRNRVYIHRSKE